MINACYLFPIVVAGVLVAPATRTVAGDSEVVPSTDSRVGKVIDTVLENHIDPPTRQEMILFGVKSVYHAADKSAPKGLSKRISELSTSQDITNYLASVRADFDQLPNLDDVLISGMFRAVLGGGVLIPSEAQARSDNKDESVSG